MGKQLSEWTEDDWVEDYRKKGEHVALVDLAGGKVEGARWLGAQKFIVAENNRRHMEPIRAASKSRLIAWVAVGISALSLGVTIYRGYTTSPTTAPPSVLPLSPISPVRATTSDAHTLLPDSNPSGTAPQKPASE